MDGHVDLKQAGTVDEFVVAVVEGMTEANVPELEDTAVDIVKYQMTDMVEKDVLERGNTTVGVAHYQKVVEGNELEQGDTIEEIVR